MPAHKCDPCKRDDHRACTAFDEAHRLMHNRPVTGPACRCSCPHLGPMTVDVKALLLAERAKRHMRPDKIPTLARRPA